MISFLCHEKFSLSDFVSLSLSKTDLSEHIHTLGKPRRAQCEISNVFNLTKLQENLIIFFNAPPLIKVKKYIIVRYPIVLI